LGYGFTGYFKIFQDFRRTELWVPASNLLAWKCLEDMVLLSKRLEGIHVLSKSFEVFGLEDKNKFLAGIEVF
jgi:hypothetical protein